MRSVSSDSEKASRPKLRRPTSGACWRWRSPSSPGSRSQPSRCLISSGMSPGLSPGHPLHGGLGRQRRVAAVTRHDSSDPGGGLRAAVPSSQLCAAGCSPPPASASWQTCAAASSTPSSGQEIGFFDSRDSSSRRWRRCPVSAAPNPSSPPASSRPSATGVFVAGQIPVSVLRLMPGGEIPGPETSKDQYHAGTSSSTSAILKRVSGSVLRNTQFSYESAHTVSCNWNATSGNDMPFSKVEIRLVQQVVRRFRILLLSPEYSLVI